MESLHPEDEEGDEEMICSVCKDGTSFTGTIEGYAGCRCTNCGRTNAQISMQKL